MLEMNILVAEFKSGTGQIWYRDETLEQALETLTECGDYIQCTYEDHILIRSKRGQAIFDKNGNLCELYDYQAQPLENIANRPDSKDLEFEMVLMFSRINE